MTKAKAHRDACVLRDFARMCLALQPSAEPTGRFTFGIASGLANEIADKLEQHGVSMAQQADHVIAELAEERRGG